MDERLALCWLGSQKDWTLDQKYRIMREHGTAKAVYDAFLEGCFFGIKKDPSDCWPDRFLEDLQKHGVSMMTIMDDDYPMHLSQIPQAPLFLLYKGTYDEEDFDETFAVVGARKASLSARKNTRRIVGDLAYAGLNIVSGMALGIDAQAHQAALDVGGKTTAVMGCGLDHCYPKENRRILDAILDEGGTVFSEFDFGTPPLPRNFPQRNRIISGLSMGVLVAEAEKKSGSLITAKHAMEQGREVYAFPGDLQRSNTLGSNLLLRDGAKMVLEANDILEDMAPMFFIPEKLDVFESKALAKEEKSICDAIRSGVDTVDSLIDSTEISISDLFFHLTNLELKGIITGSAGRYTMMAP
ncbi:DNA-processing protein DprA [Alkalibacter rhizosphaerae]|uniref:DNA-processing protein DprA n=1 Tax=Alkalibacter rhizosphaerae TaxID=2815577 RepID=A0A974XF46_9FIRM|nr:DNA-processing protein DprA [Alkalibacter rhizosphaerae]QSX08712.1 DNA-processing protein DprA [Alkalibacter rhizosphaerae]